MPRRLLLPLAIVILLTGCTTGGGDLDESTSVPPPSVTSTVTSTTTTGTSPTTTVATTSTSLPDSGPTTLPPNEGPSGSGCTPGDTVTLPEGEWFGFVEATSATTIDFDLACWFTGEAAVEAAAEDGEESPPPNDYYVRNDNTQIRSLTMSSEAMVTWYPSGDPSSETDSTFAEWAESAPERGFMFGVWIDVIDGEVLRIREQWVP